jgi:FkbM family methyltransferase
MLSTWLRHVRSRLGRWPDSFLWDVSAAVHVGASVGQEREMYRRMGLKVLWVEPIPDVFDQLCMNLKGYDWQRPVRALVSDREGEWVKFHVASNNGESSSMLAPALHREQWPEVRFDRVIELQTVTLPSVLSEAAFELPERAALILDTQGAELKVLRGAAAVLRRFRYIKTEACEFEAYAGCPKLADITGFLHEAGFREHSRHPGARGRDALGQYYDLVMRRV